MKFIALMAVTRVFDLRGVTVPIVDPGDALGIPCKYADSRDSDVAAVRAVVLGNEDERLAVEVDAVTGNDEIVVKSLGEEFHAVQGISGATILGDGSVGLIIDPSELGVNRRVNESFSRERDAAAA